MLVGLEALIQAQISWPRVSCINLKATKLNNRSILGHSGKIIKYQFTIKQGGVLNEPPHTKTNNLHM